MFMIVIIIFLNFYFSHLRDMCVWTYGLTVWLDQVLFHLKQMVVSSTRPVGDFRLRTKIEIREYNYGYINLGGLPLINCTYDIASTNSFSGCNIFKNFTLNPLEQLVPALHLK